MNQAAICDVLNDLNVWNDWNCSVIWFQSFQ
jgi:hypothetical protein